MSYKLTIVAAVGIILAVGASYAAYHFREIEDIVEPEVEPINVYEP